MSYILDALKKAESERERGVVPGLHSQSAPLRRPVTGSAATAKPLMLACAALGLAILGMLVWRSLGLAPTWSSVPGVAVSPTQAGQGVAAAPVTAVPAPGLPAKASPSGQTDKPAAVAARPKPESRQEARPTPAAAVATTAEPAATRIMPISELPADIRQTLPKVAISGSTYSDNRAMRMLIINGEVFREGEKPAPDLQLEQIGAKAAVLNFKGLRYSVAY